MLNYLVPCECGGVIAAEPAQAGMLLPCLSCGRERIVPPLTTLRRLSSKHTDPERMENHEPFQYRLGHLCTLILLLALLFAITRYLWPVLLIVLFIFTVPAFICAMGLLVQKCIVAFWDHIEIPPEQ